MSQKLSKVLSAILVVIILCMNSATIASYAAESYKKTTELESQGTSTNNENVEFDVYYAGRKHSNTMEIQADNKIYVDIVVKNAGYLENTKIDFSDCNFNIADSAANQGKIQSVDTVNKIVTLNKMAAGSNATIELNITPKKDETISPDIFNRDSTVKITGTYINSKTKQVEVKKNILINTKWHAESELELNHELERYIPYEIGDKTGLLVQTKVSLNVKGNALPIENTTIKTSAPIIADAKPIKVLVYARKTNATNNKPSTYFSNDNYSYDEKSGIVTINVENSTNDKGLIQWKKNDTDEYLVTYIYSADVYSKAKDTNTHIETNAVANCNLYNDITTEAKKEAKLSIDCSEKKNELVNINQNIQEESVAKGYMYSNKTAVEENKNETIYNVEYVAEISYSELVDKITIEESSDKFLTEDGSENNTTLAGNNYVYSKKVTVNKNELAKILGNEGYIDILLNGTSIGRINKDTKANTEGNAMIDISSYNANSIVIETSKPLSEGELRINVEKAVSKNIDYSKNQLEEFKQVKSKAITKVLAGTTAIETLEIKDTMNLTEPTSKAAISINKETLSTVVENKDVEIKAILEADSKDDLLYKNPTAYINLPKYISNINIKSVKPLYEDELTVKSAEPVDMGDHKAIKIELEGTQTKYNDSTSKGVNILVYANLAVNKAAPSVQDTITMVYTNENETVENNTVSTEVNFASPKSVVLVNGISGYSTTGEDIELASGEEGTALLDIYTEAKTATIKGQLINNYDNTISEVSILGRIPNKTSTDYDSSESVSNTFDTTLNGAISLTGLESGYTIYYSTNSSATKDITDSNNGWTTTVSDYSLIKSYLIVLDSELATTANVDWTYGLNIPADLGYKNSLISNYKVYFKNNAESGAIQDNIVSPTIKLETEKGPELTAEISSIDVEDGGTITKGKNIKFDITVTNTGSENINNVNIQIPVPNKMKYYDTLIDMKYNSETNSVYTSLTKISPKQKIEISVQFEAEETGNCKIESLISGDEFAGYIKTNEINIKIEEADIALINGIYGLPQYANGDTVQFYLMAKNLTDRPINDVAINYYLPENSSLESYYISEGSSGTIKEDSNKNLAIITFPTIETNKYSFIELNVKLNVATDNMRSWAESTVGDKKYTSNTIKINAIEADFNITTLGTEKIYVKPEEKIVSQFEIKNIGESTIYDIKIKYNIPSGTEFISGNIESKGNTDILMKDIDDEDTISFSLTSLEKEETAIVTISLNINENEEGKKILSSLTATNPKLGERKSTILTYIVKTQESDNDNNVSTNNLIDNEINNQINDNTIDNPSEENNNHKIEGKVWIDENKDGQFNNNEETISGLNVLLIDKEKDKIKTTTITNENGTYTLDNIQNGKYMIAFLYDSSVYDITEYQKAGVPTALNSDAIKSTIKYHGSDTIVGLTDTIEIKDKNIENIDLGIYKAQKFDLSLKKYVNKITINNDLGITTYDYNDKNKTLAKIDIPAKYMQSSTVIIEYKIVVKNEVDIAGYAKKIVDYLPNDLKFSSELNKKCYIGKNGNIYSEELSQIKIEPGESKEITLVLTKQMTEENTGTIVNKAEIAEDYNDLGLQDFNSSPENDNEKENDLDYANTIITVKTGQIVIYTALIIGIIGILSVGILTIKRYVIKD